MKTTTAKSRSSANKISKAPTRVSSRIAAKNVALKMEKNTRQEKPSTKKNTRSGRSPKSPTKSPQKNLSKVLDQMKVDTEMKKQYELNENLRDNPLTSRNNQNTFSFSKTQLDSYKTQMSFQEFHIDCYPSAIRAIENSDNDLAVRALHHVEKSRF
ncbi:hypothetical protein PIROE2DRAFT_62956 [Piromyces sp. E2]|nr:hypothetical protein PIROE2DRAFT_62956 [Piromyces sp. E2]|eukprot:OUM60742.1 hypothetical protein PIROE2DRAFT_62956 [Piromyces sp. E2]